MGKQGNDHWCVFLFNRKHGMTVLDTGLTEEEAQRQVDQQLAQGEKDVQRLLHGEYFKLFGQHPKIKG